LSKAQLCTQHRKSVLSAETGTAESRFDPRLGQALGVRDEFQHRRSNGSSVMPNAPMSGAEARSAEASAPLAGWLFLFEATMYYV